MLNSDKHIVLMEDLERLLAKSTIDSEDASGKAYEALNRTLDDHPSFWGTWNLQVNKRRWIPQLLNYGFAGLKHPSVESAPARRIHPQHGG